MSKRCDCGKKILDFQIKCNSCRTKDLLEDQKEWEIEIKSNFL